MAFDKVQPKPDFPALEREVLKFWESSRAFDALREKNRGKPRWSFLDGPITANNPMGVHHAWGRTYKDAFQRYFAMTGHELRYQNGFDCQGLWVEVEVEKDLGIHTKAGIEELGLDKFTQRCKERVWKYAAIQTEQSKRLGYWMDWDNSYFTMTDENNYTIWTFLKKCHELGYVYKGTDVMPWSGRAGCAYSHMEIAEGRRLVAHTAVFVRFPLRGRNNEYLLIWTTTPWTLTSNTGAAVNSELMYVKLRAKKDGALYYFAAENLNYQRLEKEFKQGFGSQPWPKHVPKLKTIHQIFQESGGYELEGEIPGSEMIGWTYDGPFDELPAQQQTGGFASPMDLIPPEQRDWPSGRDGHVVFDPGKDSRGDPYVVAGEGTGIVHSAPGCGDVDHLWGVHFRIAAIAPLDAEGNFVEGFGPLTGKRAIDPETVELIISDLKAKGVLVAAEEYPHVYPHCWRTGDELVFRLVDEWYVSMDWRDEIKEVARQVNWLPPAMRGLERELDWLNTMKDWMISKKRFWGLALPIWECNACGHFDVIGGYEELKERAVEGWDQFEGHSPHRPYVDAVKIRCSTCGELTSRIPDVGNPWLDAGIVAYSTTHYNTDREYWDKWIPADLITECFPGQFRNWFYAVLAMSTMLELGKERRRIPFKTLLGHALVLDEHRQAMHKSDGTAIWFEEAAEQLGVDVMRWMYCAQPPTADLPFGLRHPGDQVAIETPDGERITQTVEGLPLCKVTSTPANDIRRHILMSLWNCYKFFCDYARIDEFDPAAPRVPLEKRQDIDRWILSDLQLVVARIRQRFEKYELPPVCQSIEKFLDNLSNWYIRRNRRRFWRGSEGGAAGSDTDKLAAYQTLYQALVTVIELAAPVMPFVTEHMYQNLVARQIDGAEPSVHLRDYPKANERLIDRALSDKTASLLKVVSMGRSVRTASKLKVRQPLAELRVQCASDVERQAVEQFNDHLLEELNVKNVTVHDDLSSLCKVTVRADMKLIGPKYGRDAAAINQALQTMDAGAVAADVEQGTPLLLHTQGGASFEIEPTEIIVEKSYGQAWGAERAAGTVVLLDKRITKELKLEGLARDIVRHVQNLRKAADLDLQDRITLSLRSDADELREAVTTCGDYIARETLATSIVDQPLEGQPGAADARLDGKDLKIELLRA